eukprot:scaffold61313_cov30-Tisochrysis_lutea.AAC.1
MAAIPLVEQEALRKLPCSACRHRRDKALRQAPIGRRRHRFGEVLATRGQVTCKALFRTSSGYVPVKSKQSNELHGSGGKHRQADAAPQEKDARLHAAHSHKGECSAEWQPDDIIANELANG